MTARVQSSRNSNPAPSASTDTATKAYVDTGLGGKANTSHTHAQSDITGLVSALAGKEPTVTGTTSADYYRGDKTFQALNKAAVGLGNVDNTSNATERAAAATLTNKTIDGLSNGISSVSGELLPVRCVAEGGLTYTIVAGNVTQIAGTVVDTISPAIGERIAILGAPAATGVGSSQTTQPGNGIYTVTGNTTNLTVARAADFSGTVIPWGTHFMVREGVSWGNYTTYFRGSGAFIWGTTALGYATYFAPGSGYVDTNRAINTTAPLTGGGNLSADRTLALSGTTAQFNTALSDNDFATLAGTETLTGKTLTSPILTAPVLGTPASGTLTNCTGLPAAGLVTSTTQAVGFGTVELGHASDTTLARSGAGDITVEGNALYRAGGTDVPVADGGTGRSTGTTAYSLVATGTTATGAQQTLANGATTEVLVGGGAAALPVWTTAQGSGAPVRATSPTLTTPNIGTPSAGVLTNCTGLPASALVASTSQAVGVGTVELGHASDTTLSRSAAGILAVEGVDQVNLTAAQTLTNKTLTAPVMTAPVLGTPASGTLTNCTGLPATGLVASTTQAVGFGTIELGAATDTTLSRSAAGKLAVEGVDVVLLSGAQTLTGKTLTSPVLTTPDIGTPSAGTLTNCTGLPAAGLVASTTQAVGFGTIELGHTSDTTVSRVSAGKIAVEGVNVVTISSTDTLTNKTLTSPVINTPTGIVKGDVGLGSVDNTADTAKPVSTAQQTALDLKANLASPTFTGTVSGITSAMVGLGNVDNTSNATERAAVATLTNKRITKRVNPSNTPGATPTLAWDSYDVIALTGIDTAIISMSSGITGSPTQSQPWMLRLKDNATPQAITWGASYRAIGVTLPTTTVPGKTMYVGGFYNSTDTLYDVTAVGTEA